jgi:PilZ domain
MASARAMLERRRSSRVPIRVSVKVLTGEGEADGAASAAPAEAVSVSRHGALLRAPFRPDLGSRIEVLHTVSKEVREFRVISARDLSNDGLFELGVEIFHPARNFWGVQFPGERSA